MHLESVKALRPGIPYMDVYELSARVMVDGMKTLGLMKGNTEDAVREGAHALFYPHGLGHMMGLDVHDMENLGEIWVGYNGQPKSTQFGRKSQRLAIPLEPGFVHTVEPGIYFIPELIDMWRAEKKFTDFINYDKVENYKDFGGIRNEEDYLITETGARRLGKKIPLITRRSGSFKITPALFTDGSRNSHKTINACTTTSIGIYYFKGTVIFLSISVKILMSIQDNKHYICKYPPS